MRIFYNETNRSVIATNEKNAFKFTLPIHVDPVIYTQNMVNFLINNYAGFEAYKFLYDTKTEPTDDPPIPRTDAIKDEGIPRGFPKPDTQ
ncbi:hypothetical protein ES703_101746 [subsurface metagenome]